MKLELIKSLFIFIIAMAALGAWVYIISSQPNTQMVISDSTNSIAESTNASTEPSVEPNKSSKTEDENFEEKWGRSAQYIAKTIWGEVRGCSELEQRKVVWCILNRVDAAEFHDNIIGVIMAPNQFHGFHYDNPIKEEHYQMALEIISLWLQEKQGMIIKRDLEKKYLFFSANSSGTGHNFRTNW